MSADTPYDRLRHFLPEGDELGLDGYQVLHPIGEGGFGRVFLARQLAFDRDVAIKVLSATGLQEDTVRRFERECRAVGALSTHPHIVTIYDSGITAWGRPYIVMEHMAGGSLARRIAMEGPLSVSDALEMVVKICGAVAAAHRHGILHRDIKPDNLLISEYGEPALGDFGVASIPAGYQTHTGAITASLAHAAPEVLDGANATAATDVYSVGSTLFTLIAGRAPFESPERPGLQALIARTMTQPIPDLREEGVPDDICSAIEAAMSKDAAARFERPDDLAWALQQAQIAQGLPVTELVLPDTGISLPLTVEPPIDEVRTAARPRTVLDPPTPPVPRRRPRWRSPVTAAAVALALALGVGGTAALKIRRPHASPATQLAGVAPSPSPSRPATVENHFVSGPEEKKQEKKRRQQRRRDANGRDPRRKPKNAGEVAFAGDALGGGGPASTGSGSTARSSTNNYTKDGSGTRSTSGGDGGASSGGASKPAADKEPPPPPPANKTLYHLYNENGDYYFTASMTEFSEKRFEYDHYHREAAIWEAGGSGMRRVCFGDGRCGGSVYIQKPSGIQTRPLYSFTGPLGDFYTTNKSEIPAAYSGYRVYLYGYAQ